MKIEINNLGPIGKYSIDLEKSLIVTYGENNIGKSYAMQLVYLILRDLGRVYSSRSYLVNMYNPVNLMTAEAEKIVKDFMAKSVDTTDITDEVIRIVGKTFTQSFFMTLKESMVNTFGTYEQMVDKRTVCVIRDDNFDIYIDLSKESVEFTISIVPVILKRASSSFHKSRKLKSEYQIYVFPDENGSERGESAVNLIKKKVITTINDFIYAIKTKVGNVYYLPASRSGISMGMNSFGPIMAQLSQQRDRFTKGFSIASIPEPISDYYMELCSISPRRTAAYVSVAEAIEQDILHGQVLFDMKKKALLYHNFRTGDDIEMNDASSMVAEISPITAFFKYIVGNNNQTHRVDGVKCSPSAVIFIEEPEAHLHPSNQVRFISHFASIAGKGVKLVMSSHSNYIFNKLNNMVLGRALNAEVYSPMLMVMRGEKSYVKNMHMDELGVSDENFIDVAEDLLRERETIIGELMETMGEND